MSSMYQENQKTDFLGEKLRLARLIKGCTLQEAGDAVLVSRQNIHQFESGSRMPSEDIIEALAEFLGVRSSFFFNVGVSTVLPEQCHFRKRKTTPVGMANRVVAYSTLLEQLVSEFHNHLELPQSEFGEFSEFVNPEMDAESIERLSEEVRRRWGLGMDAPIDNMVNLLENKGAFITYFEGVSDKVDALSVDRRHPIIIRNTAKSSVARMRFDLAHECGHLIMHSGIETGDRKTEKEADSFASAFLFPRAAFFREFDSCIQSGRILWNKVYALKLRWKMSARAIIYRAHYLKMIDAQTYRSANVYFSRTRQTKSEKLDEKLINEQPSLINGSLNMLSEFKGMTADSFANKLGVSIELLSEIVGVQVKTQASNVTSLDAFR